jgi:SAM-dependent methyltransferase
MAAGLEYAFSNDDPEAVDRHQFLAAMLDPVTRERLAGLGPLAGQRCLELGAGGGSVAAWLVAEAGPAGRVLATDINLRHLPDSAAYETLRHDLRSEPVPPGPWDLIHARLVLLHIPDRENILRRLAAALAPGGALVLEEWSTITLNPGLVLSAPSARARELVEEYHRTLITDVLPARGNDPSWAPRPDRRHHPHQRRLVARRLARRPPDLCQRLAAARRLPRRRVHPRAPRRVARRRARPTAGAARPPALLHRGPPAVTALGG